MGNFNLLCAILNSFQFSVKKKERNPAAKIRNSFQFSFSVFSFQFLYYFSHSELKIAFCKEAKRGTWPVFCRGVLHTPISRFLLPPFPNEGYMINRLLRA